LKSRRLRRAGVTHKM